MKKYFALFLLLAACATNETVEPNQEIIIKEKTASQIIFNSKSISINISKIEDSRCPENVVCVWAGEARVTFDISIDQKLFSDKQLCLQCDKETGIPQELTIDNQTITLVAVSPFPNTENTSTEQTATFKMN